MKQRHDCFQFFECLFALLSVIINVRHEKPFSTTTFDCGTNKYSKLSILVVAVSFLELPQFSFYLFHGFFVTCIFWLLLMQSRVNVFF